MNENEQKQSVLTIPVAIVVAGALIAVSVIYVNGPKGATRVVDNKDGVTINVNPIEETDHILGNPNAPVVIVEYSDTECPFCKNFHTTMHNILDKYGKEGKVAWVYRHLPITNLHPKAWKEALATECAAVVGGGSSAFWKYTDRIYSITPSNNGLDDSALTDTAKAQGLSLDKFQSCLTTKATETKVKKDYANGVDINGGRPGTPTNVFILQNPLESDKRTALEKIVRNEGLDAFITIDDSSRKILVKGAFPYEVMSLMLDLILQ